MYIRNIKSNLISNIIKVLLTFCISVIIARTLGPYNKGVYDLMYLIFLLYANHAHFGLNNSVVHFIKSENMNKGVIISNNVFVYTVFSLIVFAILYYLHGMNILLTDYTIGFIIVSFLFGYVTLMINLFNQVYISEQKNYLINRFKLLSVGVQLILLIVLFNVLSPILVMGVLLLVNFLNLALMIVFQDKNKFKFKLDFQCMKRQYKYGFYAFLAVLFIALVYRVDQFLINSILGKESLGIYTVSVNLSELLFIIPTSISTAFLGKIYNANRDVNDIMFYTIKLSMIVVIFISVIAIACSPLIPILYGVDYSLAVYPFMILIASVIFSSIGKVSSSIFYKFDKLKVYLLISFVALILNFGLNLLLIEKYELIGAASASLISYFVYGILVLIAVSRITKRSVYDYIRITKSDFQFIKKNILQLFKEGDKDER